MENTTATRRAPTYAEMSAIVRAAGLAVRGDAGAVPMQTLYFDYCSGADVCGYADNTNIPAHDAVLFEAFKALSAGGIRCRFLNQDADSKRFGATIRIYGWK